MKTFTLHLIAHKPLIILALALTLLVGTDYLNAWTAPTSGNPPTGNVAAPINTGSATQNKNGTLGVNALAVFGASSYTGAADFNGTSDFAGLAKFNGDAEVSAVTPRIKFTDTDERDFWTYVNADTFYILADRDNAGGDWETPHPAMFYASADGTADYARFPDQVRAGTYCDVNGGNCVAPVNIVQVGDDALAGVNAAASLRDAGYTIPKPNGVTEWPNNIICEDSSADVAVILSFHVLFTSTGQIRYRDLSGNREYTFNSNGSYNGRTSINSNCSSKSSGSNLSSICNSGLCTY